MESACPCATTGGKVFFCNSGTEANEAAIKLARRWAFERHGEGRHGIVVLEGSFHGRTYGGLSATAQPKFHQGFEPMLPGFATVPLGDIDALDKALTDRVCAFFVEPIQGESGVRMHPPGYLKEAETLCRGRGSSSSRTRSRREWDGPAHFSHPTGSTSCPTL